MYRQLSWSQPLVLALTLLAAGGGVLPGCSSAPQPEPYRFAQIVMGVKAQITAYNQSPEQARAAATAAFAEMNRLEGILSDYRPDSEAMRLCDTAADSMLPTPPSRVEVSQDLYDVLAASLRVASASESAFDPTVGPLTVLWREARRSGRPPAADSLARAKQFVGWRGISLRSGDRSATRTAQLARPGMRLDFGGIGKGYAADRALAVLRTNGVPQALVALAGDIAVGDAPPGRGGWTIGISGGGPTGKAAATILIANRGASTSGDTEQFVRIDGRRYSHILDPRTGLGLEGIQAVTVVAPDATTADALATALRVLGPARAAGLLAKFPGSAALIDDPDAPAHPVFISPQFPTLFPPVPAQAAKPTSEESDAK
jgi:thiamine biosynthesis lipoprotein